MNTMRSLQATLIATAALLCLGTTHAAPDAATSAAPKPRFSLASGIYAGVQTVRITDSGKSAKIYYTTDGSTPSPASTLYASPVAIGATSTLKAIAVEAGLANSPVASAAYTITCPVIAAGCIPPLAPANVAGESGFTLYVSQVAGPTTGLTASVVGYPGFAATGNLPYSFTTTTGNENACCGPILADAAGNLWSVSGHFIPSIDFSQSVAIVELQGAAGNPATLVPTVVANLPPTINVNVGNMAFDRYGNLWLDEFNLATLDGTASIVEYTAASGYTATGTVIAYSGSNGPVGNNCGFGASMAFTPGGNLEALESYSNGQGGCSWGIFEYTPSGTPVTSVYYPHGYSGSFGTITIDAAGNLWVLAQPNGCSLNKTNPTASRCTIPGEIYEVSSSGVVLQTIPAPASKNNEQQSQGPVFDANGNLWFINRTIHNSGTCNSATLETVSLYELPYGSTTPIEQAAINTACLGGPVDFYQGIAITPRPSGLL